MKNSIIKTILLPAGSLLMLSSPVLASMGNTGMTYGLMPSDIASAQALSLFNTNVSAAWYNPAALAIDPRGELTGSVLDAENDLNVNSADPQYDGVVQDDPSRQLMIGMKTDLSSLMKEGILQYPLYLGVIAGVEKDGQQLLSFNSSATGNGPQYLEYGRKPLFLTVSVGTTLWRGIHVGAGLRVTTRTDSTLHATTNFGGETQHESLDVSADPLFRPIVGLHINWGETACHLAHCWADNLETAISYRAYSESETSVSSDALLQFNQGNPVIPLEVANVIDAFQPAVTALGVKYDFGRVAVGVTAEYQQWSRLESKLAHDTIKDQANLNFKDTIVPRIGAEIQLNDTFTLITGAAWVPSPLEGSRSLDVNYVDADRWEAGIGLRATFKHVPLMAYPVELNLGYQYQKLDERDFTLSRTPDSAQGDPSQAVDFGSVTTDGEVNVFAGSITVKF